MSAQPLQRSEWLAERKSYLGASEIAAVLGVSPFDSAHDVWLAKTKGVQKEETIPMRRGTFMEPFIASEFERATGLKTTESRLYRHPKWSFLGCNPDRETEAHGVSGVPVELKDVGFWSGKQFGQSGEDLVSEPYLLQLAFQMIVTQRKLACLCVLIDGRDLETYWYTFDPDLFHVAHVFDQQFAKDITFRAVTWWERHIIGGEEPELSGHDSDTEFVKACRREYGDGEVMLADESLDALAVRLKRAKTRKDRALFADAEIRNRIKVRMAESNASVLGTQSGQFTWKTNKNGVASFRDPFKSGKY